ncbi:hypothetical protein [Bacillus cereus]|nr:hypothetical protein [Bacillus cereus]MEC0036517.1 hypothetical protein [Bacillus cereus]
MERIEANDFNILSWLIEEVKHKTSFDTTKQPAELANYCCTKEN